MIPFAFVGPCSTEDQLDPESSRAWQLFLAEKLIESPGGKIVAGYFDTGDSRSIPWKRRPACTYHVGGPSPRRISTLACSQVRVGGGT